VQLSREAFPQAFTRGRRETSTERGLNLAFAVARHEETVTKRKAIFSFLPLAVSYHLCIISPSAAGQGERVLFRVVVVRPLLLLLLLLLLAR
jgi:hypothetical protein